MKKSFKKAGAAVLSMAMLLAMGAVSMPVYAEGELEGSAAKVQVFIPQLEAGVEKTQDADGREYEYLYDVMQTATVNVYKVGELGPNGWEWNEDLITQATASAIDDLDNEEFVTLLQRQGDTDAFAATADQMKALAAKLERLVRAAELGPVNATPGEINAGGTYAEFELPTGSAESPFKNTIGYYLILTNSDMADVVFQPSLISLKNDEPNNITRVNVKGQKLEVDKKVTALVNQSDETEVYTNGLNPISTTGHTATVGTYETVKFLIDVPIPRYDSKATLTKDLEIYDEPDDGVKILEGTSGSMTPIGDFKVYLSEDGALDAEDTEIAKLESGTNSEKYKLEIVNDTKIKVTIDKAFVKAHQNNEHILITVEGIIDSTNFNNATGEQNKARATYNNNYSVGNGDGESEQDVTLYGAWLDFDKVAQEMWIGDESGVGDEVTMKEHKVGGAIFKLEKLNGDNDATAHFVNYVITDENGKFHDLVEDASGEITIPGVYNTDGDSTSGLKKFSQKTTGLHEVGQGKYQLTELAAPAGYKKWAANTVAKFTITATKSAVTNNKGGATPTDQEFDDGFTMTIDGTSEDLFLAKYGAEGTDKVVNAPQYQAAVAPVGEGPGSPEVPTTGRIQATVLNELDDKLPATGGIGTVLFTAGGISIVLIAGALFVMYMKKRNAEDEE